MDFEIYLMIILLFLLFELSFGIFREFRRPDGIPPGPSWKIPYVGNSKYLQELSRKYGGQHNAFEVLFKKYNSPIISLKLGRQLFVIAKTYPLVKEIFAREEFDGRPDNYFMRLRTMGTRLGITATDGRHWKEQRSFVVHQLRNVGFGKSKMREQIQYELCEILNFLKETNGRSIWSNENNFISSSVVNVLWTFTTGSRIQRDDKNLRVFLDLLDKRSKLFDVCGGLLSQMPWLRFIMPEKSGYNLVKTLNSEFHKFFTQIINEHLQDYSEENLNDDLIFAFLNEMQNQEGKEDSTFSMNQLMMIILDMFIAGSQITSTSIEFLIMAMIVYPEVQEKCWQEIKKAIEDDGEAPGYDERDKLPYVQAVILEVQRFFSVVPITGPRRNLKECELGGYKIPKYTTILFSLESVLKDEDYWKNAHEFIPERFLSEDGTQIINNERFVTFGGGRRKCLGDQLAKEYIFTFLVEILSKFSLYASEAAKPSSNFVAGIILTPSPFKIMFKSK